MTCMINITANRGPVSQYVRGDRDPFNTKEPSV